MEVDDGADVRDVAACSVEAVVDGEEMAGGKAVLPLDDHALGDGRFEGRAGEAATDGPHASRRQVAVELDVGFGDGEAVAGDLLPGVVGSGRVSAGWAMAGMGSGSTKGARVEGSSMGAGDLVL